MERIDSKLLRDVRRHASLTEGQAARVFGLDPRAWRDLENGRKELRLPLRLLLECALRIPGVMDLLRRAADARENNQDHPDNQN